MLFLLCYFCRMEEAVQREHVPAVLDTLVQLTKTVGFIPRRHTCCQFRMKIMIRINRIVKHKIINLEIYLH